MNWLGQKPEPEPATPARSTAPSAPQAASHTPAPRPVEPAAPATRGATIGKSIQIKGELTGSEDLAIEGKVEGKITLSGCRVTIGSTGQVLAEIVAKSVIVGGQVRGSIRAEERVEVAASGNLLGDVRSPRVILADGAKFKGSVDMDTAPASSASAPSPGGSSSGSRPVRDPLLTPDETSLYGSKSGS